VENVAVYCRGEEEVERKYTGAFLCFFSRESVSFEVPFYFITIPFAISSDNLEKQEELERKRKDATTPVL